MDKISKTISFRPLSRYGWGPTLKRRRKMKNLFLFPAPREVWVGSYMKTFKFKAYGQKFPSPLEVWVGSYNYDYI